MTDCVLILFCSVSVLEEGRRQTDISLPSSIWPNVSLLFFLFHRSLMKKQRFLWSRCGAFSSTKQRLRSWGWSNDPVVIVFVIKSYFYFSHLYS